MASLTTTAIGVFQMPPILTLWLPAAGVTSAIIRIVVSRLLPCPCLLSSFPPSSGSIWLLQHESVRRDSPGQEDHRSLLNNPSHTSL